jgi:hypothetical protein
MTWTGEMVRNRLVEAFEIDRRLPRDRLRTTGSAWPAKPIHEFVDVVYWNEGEQRERVWESWERSASVSPQEITRMETAFLWLRLVPITERRCLEAWAKAAARGFNVKRMIKGTWSRSTFYRQRDHAAQIIADNLNKHGDQEVWQTNPSP